MRSPEELREDKSVFMNQGEWELLHILSKYKSFSVDNDDYYAEMKFHVSFFFFSHCLYKLNEWMVHFEQKRHKDSQKSIINIIIIIII